MTFELQDILTPTTIGRIDHYVDDLDGTNPNRAIQYNLEILDQFGDILKVRSGDEQPHMTAGQISQLLSFMDSRRANLPADLGFAAGNVCGRITWRFRDLDGTNPNRSLYARVIEQAAGGAFVQVHQVNDQPNMSGAQITAAIQFLDDQRAKAEEQILP